MLRLEWSVMEVASGTLGLTVISSLLAVYLLRPVFISPTEIYRVTQNKPDYLLLLSKFCTISTTKCISMIMYV